MASISSIGIGSGLDLENIVTQVVNAERAPKENRLNVQEAQIQASISAYGNLKSVLSSFQDSLAELKSADTFSQRKVSSGDRSMFTATADNTAEVGTHQISVLNLAQEHTIATKGFAGPDAVVGSGDLTIGVGSESFSITGLADASLSDIRDAINNATDNKGVRASLLTVDAGNGDGSTETRLVLTSDETGAANEISITVTNDTVGDNVDSDGLSQLHFDPASTPGPNDDPPGVGSSQMMQISAAQDARITVDGFTAYSSTNTFEGVVDGVTITAKEATEDINNPKNAAMVVTKDTASVTDQISQFVESYNELVNAFNQLTDYDQDSNTRGLLSGDGILRNIEAQIRSVINSSTEGAPDDLNRLSALGIATQKDGTLKLDKSALNNIAADRFDEIAQVFTGEQGFATRLDERLEQILGSGGAIQTKEDSFQNRLRDIEDDRENLAYRLDKIEARFRSQFSSMDMLVQQLNSTGDFLMQQLEATANIINAKKK